MGHDHARATVFEFKEDRHTGVYLCGHVAEGASVLRVSHDADGDWQFLCGAVHGEGEEPRLQCLEHIVARDPSLNQVAKLCIGHSAERASSVEAWIQHDDHEDFIRDTIRRHGWSVQMIPAGSEPTEPAFAYTVGLFHSYQHAELIMFGLETDMMRDVLNDLGHRIRDGQTLNPGSSLGDVLEGFDVGIRRVEAEKSFKEHVGYAMWFYERRPFPLLQVLWPDKAGRFPGESGAAEFLKDLQPLLP